MMKVSMHVFNLQEFEQNKIPLKQRSFEDSIDTFLSLFDADMDEYFLAWFLLPSCILCDWSRELEINIENSRVSNSITVWNRSEVSRL